MEKREQLAKSLKPHWVWAIAFGSAIGWGAFVLPVDWMATSGPLGVIIGYSIGAALMIIIGVSYGYLIERLPVSGGEFAYTYVGLGRFHAFFCGWFLTLGYMSIVALNASALALLGKFVLPSVIEQGYMYTIAGWDVYIGEIIVACIALIAFALVNIRGASLSGFTQFIFCICLLGGVILLTIAMILHPSSSFSYMQPLFKPEVGAISSIIAIVAIAPWAYIGFDNIPQAAEECKFTAKKSFKLIVITLLCSALVYALTTIATAVGQAWISLVEAGSAWGTGMVVVIAYGTFGIIILAFALMMGVFTGLNGFYVSTNRLLFAMGRAKVLPKTFGKLHSKYKTPQAGILFTLIATMAAPFFGREVLMWIVDMSSLGVTIAYFYACFVAYRLFRWSVKQYVPNNQQFSFVSRVRKVLSLLVVISSIGVFLLLVTLASPGFLSSTPWIALIVWISLGALFFAMRFKNYRSIPKKELDYLVLGEYSASKK